MELLRPFHFCWQVTSISSIQGHGKELAEDEWLGLRGARFEELQGEVTKRRRMENVAFVGEKTNK